MISKVKSSQKEIQKYQKKKGIGNRKGIKTNTCTGKHR